jgi:acyl-CoA thioester hydrolase
MHDKLAGFPVVRELDLGWNDMDAFEHVNNVVYFRYFENARVDYMTRIGWFALKVSDGIGPIVASTQARFRKPLAYPDRVWVGARIISVESDRVTFEHRLLSRRWNDVAAEGQAVVVCYDYRNGTKVPLTTALRQQIDELEKA